MTKWNKALLAAVAAAVVAAAVRAADAPKTEAPARELTAVNIEYRGSKIWVPSVFIAKKGEKVRLTLINNAPSGVHAFAVDELGIKVEVPNDEKNNKKVVEFAADKAGLFRSYCSLHPAHVGGEILVIE